MCTTPPPPTPQCDWCGALNDHAAPPPPSPAAWRAAGPRPPRRPPHQSALGAATAALVLLLVGAVAALGAGVVLPRVASPAALAAVHLPAAAALLAGILYNYCAALASHPGPAPPAVAAALGPPAAGVPRGAAAGFRWCADCVYAKPPAAHHCRRCATCIMGLDHHCVYLGSRCVGAANLAPFNRFLAFLLAGAAYALAAAAAALWAARDGVRRHTAATWAARAAWPAPLRLATFTWRWVLAAPLELGCCAVVGFLCAGAGAGVALLLHRQLALARRGETHLEGLAARRREWAAMQAGGGGDGMGREKHL
jgi:hypothetical protein